MGKDYFSNVMAMFAHFRQNLYHFINAPVDRTTYTWNLISFPFTVNAFHLQQLNSIGKTCHQWKCFRLLVSEYQMTIII